MNVKSFVSDHCPSSLRPVWQRIENSPTGSRLAQGMFWSLAGAMISRGLMLAAWIFVARILGKTGFGELGMIRATVGMVGVFAGFGLGLTATKHVAEFRRKDPDRAGRFIALSSVLAMVSGGLMALVLFIFASRLSEHAINAPHLAEVLRIGALMLFLNALNGAQTGALSGLEAFKAIAIVNLCVGLISFPVLILATYSGGLRGAAWGLTINLGVNWLLNHLALRRATRRYGIPLTLANWSRERSVLWEFSLPSVISGTMVGPVIWVSKVTLANQPDGYAELSVFTVAEQWQRVTQASTRIIAGAFLPVLSQLYGDGQSRLFKKTWVALLCVNTSITLLGSGTVAILSKPIMSAYGTGFSEHVPVLLVTILATIPAQLTTASGLINKAIGNIWWGVLLNSLWAIALLGGTSLLVKYGALGLASAFLASYCLHLAFTMIYVLWVFKTSPKLNRGAAQ